MRSAVPFLLSGVVVLSACSTKPKRAPSPPSGPITELHILALPTALNLDDRPGPDAAAVKVYAIPQGSARAGLIREGTLEVLAYPGTLDLTQELPAPFHTWTFTPADLVPFRFEAALGTGYNLVLSCAPKAFPNERLTLVGRYLLRPDARPVYSPPNVVAASFQ